MLLTDPLRPTFASVLKSLRQEAGLSQDALAERARVSTKAISALECGLRKRPYPKTIALLADALELSDSERRQLLAAARDPAARDRTQRGELKPAPSDNLPLEIDRLIGRVRESAEISRLLEDNRLVTIVGPGGIGKTRMALDVARALRERFPQGVWFCDLAPLVDGELVPAVIAAACGVHLRLGETPARNLASELGAASVLLVLDNCEQVVEHAAAVAAELLKSCPVTILATSRRRIGAAGEAVFSMPPLAVPNPGLAHELTADRARTFGAVELFIRRASAASPDFALCDEHAQSIVRICRRLDGLALAIELAAAHLRVVSIAELEKLLERRLQLLRGSAGDGAQRHRTMVETLAWSYDLLGERQRGFFRALSIFAGSFTLEAALEVCCEPGSEELSALELLAELVDQSLLVVDSTKDVTRYRLLETTRAFAFDRLVALGERAALAARHLIFFRAHSNAIDFALDLEDVRAALTWALAGGDVLAGAALAAGVGGLWEILGLAAEGLRRLNAFVAAVPAGDVDTQARLWVALSFLHGNAMRMQGAFDAAQRALGFARRSPDPAVLCDALRAFAVFASWHGRFGEADAALEEAQAIAPPAPSRIRMRLVMARGHVARRRRSDEDAAAAFAEAAALARVLDDPQCEILATTHLAEAEHGRGATEKAIALLEGLRADRRLRWIDAPMVLANLAGYALAVDNVPLTRAAVRELLALHAHRATAQLLVRAALEHLALAEALDGRTALAAKLLGSCSAWYREVGFVRQSTEQRSFDRITKILRERLTNAQIDTLASEGVTWDTERAIREAFAERNADPKEA